MAELSLFVDDAAFQKVSEVFEGQAARLSGLLEELHPDHALRQFEMPVGDLATAVADAGMLAVVGMDGGCAVVVAHPVLVKFGELVDAISNAIEAKGVTDAT